MLLQSWLARLQRDFARYAPRWADARWADAAGLGRTLQPAVVPVWSGAPGDVRRRAGRRARRDLRPRAADHTIRGPRQRLA